MTTIYKPRKPERERTIACVYGDCLERAGIKIPHEGLAIIDSRCEIKVGDLVCCTKVAGALSRYMKQVKEIKDDVIVVGTAYIDSSKDYVFEAAEIYGVVTDVFCKFDGSEIYHRGE